MKRKLRTRIEPLIGGVQIQNRKRKGIGTLACVVFDIESGEPCGLSNKHILRKRKGKSVIQPAYKPRTNKYVVGAVFRKSENYDCAIFKIDTKLREIDYSNSIFGVEGKILGMLEPEIGMKIQKVGQFTGRTYGIVEKVFRDGRVKIIPNPQKPVKEISLGGDSGSLWITDTHTTIMAVCLHTGGEGDLPDDTAWGIKISLVMEDLKVRF